MIRNSSCKICNKGLPWIKKQICMLGCGHLYHYDCVCMKSKCNICEIKIKKNDITLFNPHQKSKNRNEMTKRIQEYNDILSVTNFDINDIDGINVMKNLPILLNIIGTIPLNSGKEHGLSICNKILSMLNCKINIHNNHLLNKKNKIVYIANHTCYMDFIILFLLLECGFLSSEAINDNYLTSMLLNIIPCVIIKRGIKMNTVEQMKDYVDKHGSICLFPEGMMTHPETLIKFRTGAFHIGYPVQPIVIKYKKPIANMNIGKFICLLASGLEDIIDVYVLPEYKYPFNDKKIEEIRNEMSKQGDLLLSNVSNKDIKDQ